MKATYHELRELFDRYDTAVTRDTQRLSTETDTFRAVVNEYFAAREAVQTVVGIDIYRYSHLDAERQRLIPTVFTLLYHVASRFCWEREAFLFRDASFDENFISTGDGGYQVMPTPLQGLVFALYFELALSAFNAHAHYPRVRRLLGPISVRYALTYDTLCQQDANFYGTAIINNARILARDTLNRFLVDASSIEWFRAQIGTLESLTMLSVTDVVRLPAFADADQHADEHSMLFRDVDEPLGESPIRAVNVQKIGLLTSKQTQLDIYNVHIQAVFSRAAQAAEPERPMVVALGNLNTEGIVA